MGRIPTIAGRVCRGKLPGTTTTSPRASGRRIGNVIHSDRHYSREVRRDGKACYPDGSCAPGIPLFSICVLYIGELVGVQKNVALNSTDPVYDSSIQSSGKESRAIRQPR